ncbi:ubiquitin conjugation factor E4 [Corchorus olitorius]|uniref:Ubiquitin conjugation factor E4 n=1 Tax=Corchorus olitorius TaxID=93759 RepID=A0A1R3L305_9ROSI|nr:ubiquitin conjugation factor E4 [Corchorus olitorius]
MDQCFFLGRYYIHRIRNQDIGKHDECPCKAGGENRVIPEDEIGTDPNNRIIAVVFIVRVSLYHFGIECKEKKRKDSHHHFRNPDPPVDPFGTFVYITVKTYCKRIVPGKVSQELTE